MSAKPRVLVGFADALAAVESAWCLVDHGFEVVVFARRGRRAPLARSRNVRVVEICAPEHDSAAAVAELVELVRTLSPAAIVPLDDQSLWVCDRSTATGDHLVAGPTGAQARLALDKRLQLELARRAGFATPVTSESSELPPGEGPWMVKPALAVDERPGRLRRAVGRIVRSTGEAATVAHDIDGPVLVQPVVRGVGEGVFGLATRGEVTALTAHRRLRMMNPRGSGSSACRSVDVDPQLVEPTRKFVEAAGWQGLFMIELLRDNAGTPWFMELNGRAWGSMALARARGYAYMSWSVQAALRSDFAPPVPAAAPHVSARHFGRELVHVGAVLSGAGGSPLGTLRQVLTLRRGERWYNWRRTEPGVFVADTWATVRGQLMRRSAFGR